MIELRNEASIQDLLSEAQRRRRERKLFHRSCVVGMKGAWREVSNSVKCIFVLPVPRFEAASLRFGCASWGRKWRYLNSIFVVICIAFVFLCWLRFSQRQMHGRGINNVLSLPFIYPQPFITATDFRPTLLSSLHIGITITIFISIIITHVQEHKHRPMRI